MKLITGVLIKLVGMIVIMLATNSWLYLIFDTNLYTTSANTTLISNASLLSGKLNVTLN